jgi:hypothetical protein
MNSSHLEDKAERKPDLLTDMRGRVSPISAPQGYRWGEPRIEYGSRLDFIKIATLLSFPVRHISQAEGESARPKPCWYRFRAILGVRETTLTLAVSELPPHFQRSSLRVLP